MIELDFVNRKEALIEDAYALAAELWKYCTKNNIDEKIDVDNEVVKMEKKASEIGGMLYCCDTDIELDKFEDQLKDIQKFYYEIMKTKNEKRYRFEDRNIDLIIAKETVRELINGYIAKATLYRIDKNIKEDDENAAVVKDITSLLNLKKEVKSAKNIDEVEFIADKALDIERY